MHNDGRARPSYAQERRISAVCRGRGPAADPPAKNVPLLCRVPADVTPGQLRDAVDELVRRHPALRHRFDRRAGEVTIRPVAADAAPVEFTVTDRSRLADDAAVGAHIRAEVDRPFDVLGWPLIRAGVITGDASLFYLSADHLVTDGWSMQLAARELEAIVTARAAGAEPELPPADDPVARAAAQCRVFAHGPRLDRAVDEVRDRLAGRPLEPLFPIDAGPWDGLQGRYVDVDLLDAEETAQLLRLCRDRRTTPFMVVLAAYGIAVRECTGRTETGVLIATANREDGADRNGFGWYANMLPVHFPTGSAAAFDEAVTEVRGRVMAMLGHHALPLARLLSQAPEGVLAGVGETVPTCFVSFVDVRTPPGFPEPRWEQLDLAPSYRMSYGIWVVQRDSGLRAVIAAPRAASDGRLAAFEARLPEILRARLSQPNHHTVRRGPA